MVELVEVRCGYLDTTPKSEMESLRYWITS
jgi:hypothetical protein